MHRRHILKHTRYSSNYPVPIILGRRVRRFNPMITARRLRCCVALTLQLSCMRATWLRTSISTVLILVLVQVEDTPKVLTGPRKKRKYSLKKELLREIREAEFDVWERDPLVRFFKRAQLIICWYVHIRGYSVIQPTRRWMWM